jgi:hypothetical protein
MAVLHALPNLGLQPSIADEKDYTTLPKLRKVV